MFIKHSKIEDIEIVTDKDTEEFDHELTREKLAHIRAQRVLEKRSESNKLEN